MLGKINRQSENTTFATVKRNPALPIDVSPSEILPGGENGDRRRQCAIVQVNLAGYLDGEMDAAQAATIEQHLDGCPVCSQVLDNMTQIDEQLEREWRESSPLPSSFEFTNAIDGIMAALPEPPRAVPTFTPKRIHARARWMRFATGLTSLITLLAILWSSYRIGYKQGQQSRPTTIPTRHPQPPNHRQ